MALVVVTPALEPVEQAVAAIPALPVTTEPVRKMEPALPDSAALDPETALYARATVAQRDSRAQIQRASRAQFQRASRARVQRTDNTGPTRTFQSRRPATTRTTSHQDATATRQHEPTTRSVRTRQHEPTTRSVRTRQVRKTHRTVARTRAVTRRAATSRAPKVMRVGKMSAVIAYAKAHVGARYVSGGEGRGGFDCSGLTRQAYAKAGIRLPHSSGAQAARARRISRSQARPGDLVVGRGHVGIYMGNNMMIDAGNSRTGVVYRKLYSGLSVERLRD